MLEAIKMDKHKDLREFDKGQIVTARHVDQSISKTAALVGCSCSAVERRNGDKTANRVMGGQGSLLHVGRGT